MLDFIVRIATQECYFDINGIRGYQVLPIHGVPYYP